MDHLKAGKALWLAALAFNHARGCAIRQRVDEREMLALEALDQNAYMNAGQIAIVLGGLAISSAMDLEKKLAAKELIAYSETAPRDKRKGKSFTLSDEGRKVLGQERSAAGKHLGRLLEGIAEESGADLEKLFGIMEKGTQQYVDLYMFDR